MPSRTGAVLFLASCFLAPRAVAEASADPKTPLEAYRAINTGFHDLENNEPVDAREIALGRQLFFEARLSVNGKMSCATCHDPAKAWADGLRRARGRDGKELQRNTPSLLNLKRKRDKDLFWDGRAPRLEHAIRIAAENRLEMSADLSKLADRIKSVPGYASQFEALAPGAPVTADRVVHALAAFLRRGIVDPPTPFDRFASDASALNAAQQRGMQVFVGKAKCLHCHFGPSLTDNYFHDTGLLPVPGVVDPGRYGVIPNPVFWRAFKTPPLRYAALTAPYMHDGSLKTLEEVVEFYDRGGDVVDGRDDLIHPLGLTREEKSDLTSFLRSLSAPLPRVERPALPE